MSVWEFIGWVIAVPLALTSLVFVFAVSVAVVRVTAKRARRKTATRHLRPVDLWQRTTHRQTSRTQLNAP